MDQNSETVGQQLNLMKSRVFEVLKAVFAEKYALLWNQNCRNVQKFPIYVVFMLFEYHFWEVSWVRRFKAIEGKTKSVVSSFTEKTQCFTTDSVSKKLESFEQFCAWVFKF